MPSTMSCNAAPHLPATRTGSIEAPQWMPAPPMPLSVWAATMPAMMVPCQELFSTAQPENSGLARSALLT